MENQYTYSASVDWTGERKGTVSSGSLPQLQVATPPEFPSGHKGLWSPEHYFVASVTSCLMTTFLAIAENSKLGVKRFSARGSATMQKTGSTYEFSSVEIEVSLAIDDEEAVKKAERILQKSEENCFISRSIKAPVHLKPEISVAQL